MSQLKFPDGFLWGAATSSHQVEGNNHNDWSEWEEQNAKRLAQESAATFARNPHWQKFSQEATNPTNYISGTACDHWNRYEEDFDLLQSLHLNAYRFSIEWSRIEPEEGKFDEQAIEHYRRMFESLRRRGIEPFVTLWHWTNPTWVESHYGGWENPEVGEKFVRFVERVVTEYKDLARYWTIFNEPNTFVGHGYVQANRPPARRSLFRARRAIKNFMRTHHAAYAAIHRLDPNAQVVLSHFLVSMRPFRNKWISRLIIPALDYIRNWQFFNKLEGSFDMIGMQFYSVEYINVTFSWKAWGPISRVPLGIWQSDIGWELEPGNIEPLLSRISRFGKPIFITENGVADRDDISRPRFIQQTLEAVHRAIENGVDVRGYFHWSLLDNFEWSEGYWPRFGLIAVDRTTQERTIRPSARAYAQICKDNALETESV